MGSPHRTVLAAAVLFVLLVAGACDRADESWEVILSVDLETGQEWTASGPAVDRGQFCPNGTRHVVRGIDPATSDIVRVGVWFDIMESAITERNSTEITFVVEHTCTDGSGSFTTTERWGPDLWSVESGTGAYRDLRGAGRLSFATTDYMTAAPLRLYLDGTLHR